jgi:hypothetical protein
LAKARKTARKTSGGSRKAASKKAAGKKAAKKRASKPAKNELNLGPIKKQIRDHVKRLSAARSADPRVAGALETLSRAQSELDCGDSMILPLE